MILGKTAHEGLIDIGGVNERVEERVVVWVHDFDASIGEVTCRCKAGCMRVSDRR